jgi:hypothetical protein
MSTLAASHSADFSKSLQDLCSPLGEQFFIAATCFTENTYRQRRFDQHRYNRATLPLGCTFFSRPPFSFGIGT